MRENFRWYNSNTASSNSSCYNSRSICSHLRASFNTLEVMLHSLLAQELILFIIHLLLKIIIRCIIQSIVNSPSNKVQQILVSKKVSKQFKALQSNNHLLSSSLAHRLKAPNSKFTRYNHSLNSLNLHSYRRNNSNNSSRYNLISHTRGNHRCSSRNKQSNRLPKST